ncbi:MAG TPA: hypothetical protein VFC03_20680 [Acidimicrobiales bacterium]|nr:hypothetical protein [Acidimicrobiales bacterium]
MDHRDRYANAVRAEPGACWRMVSRGPGYRVDTPPTPRARAMGRSAMVGRNRTRPWSGVRHFEGLEVPRPVGRASSPLARHPPVTLPSPSRHLAPDVYQGFTVC